VIEHAELVHLGLLAACAVLLERSAGAR